MDEEDGEEARTQVLGRYGTELNAKLYLDDTCIDTYKVKYIQGEGMVG